MTTTYNIPSKSFIENTPIFRINLELVVSPTESIEWGCNIHADLCRNNMHKLNLLAKTIGVSQSTNKRELIDTLAERIRFGKKNHRFIVNWETGETHFE